MLSEAGSSTDGLKSSFGLQRAKRNEKHKVTIHKWKIATNLKKDIR